MWILKQNELHFKGKLNIYKTRYLSKLPQWEWNKDYDELHLTNIELASLRKWWIGYECLKREVKDHGWPPSKRTHGRAYTWWNTQRRNLSNLCDTKLKALQEVNELWHLNNACYKWQMVFKLVQKFLLDHNRLPFGQGFPQYFKI